MESGIQTNITKAKTIWQQLHKSIRNIEAGNLLENFLISAVFSLISLRVFLTITGFPRIGGETLHIAHLLFGGILMTLSIFVLLVFLNRESKQIASVIGGIGFGAFIDELGKFITTDNNYFFEPAISIIYLIFVFLFLLARSVEQYLHYLQSWNLVSTQDNKQYVITDEGKAFLQWIVLVGAIENKLL